MTTVLVFGNRRPPRALAGAPAVHITDPTAVDEAIGATTGGTKRVVVVGSDADLAVVLTRLLRIDRLDVEVAHLGNRRRPWFWPPSRFRAPSWFRARRAMSGPAERIPLIRDDTGTVLVGSALWLPSEKAAKLHGEAVVDDAVLFDGDVAGVRIEPTRSMPGLRATVLGCHGRYRIRGRHWVHGRAAQLGTTGVRVILDGVPGRRESKRSTFYRHTTGWLRVNC